MELPPGLPPWVQELRPHQAEAIEQTVEAFTQGSQVVFLDGPTGSGKTLIGETVRLALEARGIYICSSLTLQDQFARDYPYARVLKGRSNYPTQHGRWPDITAADCTATGRKDGLCLWCDHKSVCPYEVAKRDALHGDLAVTNTAYFLAEANHIGRLPKGRDLVVVDECDVMEQEVMGFVEFRASGRMLKSLGLEPPVKAARKTTIEAWLTNFMAVVMEAWTAIPAGTEDVAKLRRRETLANLHGLAERILPRVTGDEWIRDYEDRDDNAMVLKPVVVDSIAPANLWKHGDRFLLMSATIISPEEMAQSLGLDEVGWDWTAVFTPMTFPVWNRPIYVTPVADMSKAGQAGGAVDKAVRSVVNIVNRYPSDTRVLVHSVAYKLTQEIATGLSREFGRRVMHYRGSREREGVVQRYLRTPGAILVAPSMDRGVDFADDLCRVQIVAKVPFPNLGDRQVSTRMHLPGGNLWYQVQAVRTLVQMTGRGVRSKRDWCDTWILDQQFTGNLLRKSRSLLPQWWRDALIMDFDVREIL